MSLGATSDSRTLPALPSPWRPLSALCPRFHMQTSATRTYIRRPGRPTPTLIEAPQTHRPFCVSASQGDRPALPGPPPRPHPHPSPQPPRGDLNQTPEAYPAVAVHAGSCSPSSPVAILPLSGVGQGGETTSPVSLCGGGRPAFEPAALLLTPYCWCGGYGRERHRRRHRRRPGPAIAIAPHRPPRTAHLGPAPRLSALLVSRHRPRAEFVPAGQGGAGEESGDPAGLNRGCCCCCRGRSLERGRRGGGGGGPDAAAPSFPFPPPQPTPDSGEDASGQGRLLLSPPLPLAPSPLGRCAPWLAAPL